MIPSHKIRQCLQLQFQAHPWHGISAQPKPHDPAESQSYYNAYIELTPTDGVKYEVDKETGHIKVDRPQKFSNLCPTLYGFIPRTFCGPKIGDFCAHQLGREGIEGDGDPLDICVLTEKPIGHTGILVTAKAIGGLRMVDSNQADDKIVAVLVNDVIYGHLNSIEELPPGLLDRLRQYFLTYKMAPPNVEKVGNLTTLSNAPPPPLCVEIPQIYGHEEALEVIRLSQQDYKDKFGSVHVDLAQFLFELARTVGAHSETVSTAEVPS